MAGWVRRAGAWAALPMLVCAACSDPHSGSWAPSPSATSQASPSSAAAPTSSRSSATPSTGQHSETPGPSTDLEQWLLTGFEDADYSQASVRVHGSHDAWVGTGSQESAPERFAHAWPTEESDRYADEGTLLRSTTIDGVPVRVLQHVWGVSARFDCGAVTIDAYAQAQVEHQQSEAEALSLAEALMAPLRCAGDGFRG